MRQSLILATLLVGLLPVGHSGATTPSGAVLRVRGADIVDGKGRPVVLRGVSFGNEVLDERPAAAAPSRRGRLRAHRRDGDERGALLHELPDVRGRRGAGEVPGRRLAMAGRQHRVGQAPRRLPDPQHARPAGRLPVAGRGQGALGSPGHAGPPDRAVDRDRASLQGGADGRRLRSAQRAGGHARGEPVARSRRPHRGRDPRGRSRPHAVRGAPEFDRGRLEGRRGPQLLPDRRPEHGLRVPLLQAVSLHAPERVVGAVRGGRRALSRRARRGRVVPARSQGGNRGEPEATAWRQRVDLLSGRAVSGRRSGDRRRQAGAGRQGERGQGLVRRL